MTDPATRLVYADSSALVKLVIAEGESSALDRELSQVPTTLVVSRIAVVEVTRAVRLANPEQLPESERLMESCSLITVSEPILGLAKVVSSLRVRTLDAIHLATALHVAADTMAVYDEHLAEAAQAAGMRILAPRA